MAIQGFLRPRLARLGKIRLGKKAISAKSGAEYPSDLPGFRVPEEVARNFPSRPGEEFRPELEKLRLAPLAAGSAPACRVSVRYSDFDGNGHVNNTTYLDILQTALARSGLSPRPQTVEAQFLKEIPPAVEWVDVLLERRANTVAFGIGAPDGLFAQGQVA